MNILLVVFAIPLATIILASVLQKVLNCPLLVAAVFFAIFLVVAIALGNPILLVLVIIYTLLAFLAALITKVICNCIGRLYSDVNNANADNNRRMWLCCKSKL